MITLSAAWRNGLERRFYDDHDRTTPNLVSLLRPRIRCFTTIISAWWNLTSSKLKKSEEKFNRKTWKQRQILSESGFVQRIPVVPPPISRNRRINMKKLMIRMKSRNSLLTDQVKFQPFFKLVERALLQLLR